MDKNRQYQKLQGLYDALRRRCIVPSNMDADSSYSPRKLSNQAGFSMTTTTADDILRRGPTGSGDGRVHSPAEREFVFRPNSTPDLSKDQRSKRNGVVQRRFNVDLGTPKDRQPRP